MSVAPEKVFSDSLQTLYDHTPVVLSSAGSIFTYTLQDRTNPASDEPGGASLRIRDNSRPSIVLNVPETQASNWSLHASSIWASSVLLADHIDDLYVPKHIASLRRRATHTTSTKPQQRPAVRILELGAGAGLPGIYIASLYGPCVQVTSSDYPDPSLIRTLEENVERNKVSRNCIVVPYAWGADIAPLCRPRTPSSHPTGPEGSVNDAQALDARKAPNEAIRGEKPGFDLIVAADVLWDSSSHTSLLQTLTWTLNKTSEAKIHLVAGLHTGRYTLQTFMNLLPESGLEIDSLEERKVDGTVVREWSLERAEGEDESERRKWAVWVVLKWSQSALPSV